MRNVTISLPDDVYRRARFGLSYWDAAILEAARSLGCETVLSEDLQHGGECAGVRVVDPFR